ncbi:hypothetical protein [Leptothoe sp. PORK10 BA2]|uniref:slr1601 family putative cell division protein n=1 Tax=Leptothoe sp. PORK10 BA2 TaxID=3110254 RepID=UPI002B20C3F6|nr:hypothetical protein [Leptothoe sp. PORK10 BA2]MEA5466266.1 hypothetical protein [Leptothoe sp. PORK10 BA2]
MVQPKTPLRVRGKARQSLVLESTVKLTVNILLAVVAASTLAKLVPYYRQQQAELDQLNQSILALEKERDGLWEAFSHNFDPEQSGRIMREQSGQEDPGRHPIVLIDPLQNSQP